jgi:uncharacterized HAD superfamily protein
MNTNATKLRIAVDFDGVLFDHVPYVLRGFRDRDYFQYRAVQEKRLSRSCVREVLMDIETDPLLHQEPPRDPLCVQVMADWIAAGHTVDVVTARHPLSEVVTRQFLEMNQVPYHALRMGVRKKTGYDILVDDAPHNVLMAVASGSYALLMDHPYNRDVPTNGNPHRVRTWQDVDDCVQAYLRKRTLLAAGAGADEVHA